MYSALKRRGVPLYKLARRGIEIERARRTVVIDSLRLEAMEGGRLRFELSCSKGTYVRVLAADIGIACGSAAHLSALRRTRFGDFRLTEAVSPDLLERDSLPLLSIRRALGHLPAVQLDHSAAVAVRHGQAKILTALPLAAGASQAALLGPGGEVLAVAVCSQGRWRFGRVLTGA